MSRIHATLIALVVSAGATGVAYAGVATVHLGQASAAAKVPVQQLASRQAKLAAWSRSLDAALAKRLPALPKLPHFAPVHVQAAPAGFVAAAAPPATAQPHVTYVKPPPVVKYEQAPPATTTTSSSSGDDEGDDDGDHSGDDDGDDHGDDH